VVVFAGFFIVKVMMWVSGVCWMGDMVMVSVIVMCGFGGGVDWIY